MLMRLWQGRTGAKIGSIQRSTGLRDRGAVQAKRLCGLWRIDGQVAVCRGICLWGRESVAAAQVQIYNFVNQGGETSRRHKKSQARKAGVWCWARPIQITIEAAAPEEGCVVV